jgi:hypothetical protein
MASFKFIKQLGPPTPIGRGQYSYVGKAVPVDGLLTAGMCFRGFETYHPVDFAIRSVVAQNDGSLLIDSLSEWELYDGFLDGAFVDTAGTTRGVHFFWDHSNKYGGNT